MKQALMLSAGALFAAFIVVISGPRYQEIKANDYRNLRLDAATNPAILEQLNGFMGDGKITFHEFRKIEKLAFIEAIKK